nr:GAF domain-containing sensor histidine kinase [Desulfobulbaceae bacterium]
MDNEHFTFAGKTVNSLSQARTLLKNISQITHILSEKSLKLSDRLDKLLRILLDYLGVVNGSIMIFENNKLVVAAATRTEIVGIEQPLDESSVAGWVALHSEAIFIPDIAKDSRFAQRGGTYKKNSVLSAPVIQDDKLLGVINVTDKEGDKDFLKEDITYLIDFSGMIISILVQQKLQKQLKRKKDSLKEKNQKLRHQESLRDELYRMLIHDLKAPLAEVVANLDILSYSISDDNRDFLESAQIGCDRTIRMVSNLISINKIEDGKLTLCKEEVNLTTLLEESYSAIKGLANIKDVTLRIEIEDDLPIVYLDRIIILRVLQNLLTNALGYTESNTTLTAGCRKVPDKQKIEFFVQDQGEGISEEKQESIFEKYSRLSDKQDALVGTGLGLYFCRLAVELHNGKIGVTSAPGQGCRFFFRLPL